MPASLQIPRGFLPNPEDFFIPSVPRLHFEGSENTRAKERIISWLLATVVETREFGQAENRVVGDDYPIPPPPRPRRNPREGRKRLREPSSNSLTDPHPHFCSATLGNSPTALKASEVPRVAPWPKDPSQPILPPFLGPEEQRP